VIAVWQSVRRSRLRRSNEEATDGTDHGPVLGGATAPPYARSHRASSLDADRARGAAGTCRKLPNELASLLMGRPNLLTDRPRTLTVTI
jgi:hypothetical protein